MVRLLGSVGVGACASVAVLRCVCCGLRALVAVLRLLGSVCLALFGSDRMSERV